MLIFFLVEQHEYLCSSFGQVSDDIYIADHRASDNTISVYVNICKVERKERGAFLILNFYF